MGGTFPVRDGRKRDERILWILTETAGSILSVSVSAPTAIPALSVFDSFRSAHAAFLIGARTSPNRNPGNRKKKRHAVCT